MQLFLETSSWIRYFVEDNVPRKSAALPICSEIYSSPLCFDYSVHNEMILNLRMIKTMQLILFNHMSLPY